MYVLPENLPDLGRCCSAAFPILFIARINLNLQRFFEQRKCLLRFPTVYVKRPKIRNQVFLFMSGKGSAGELLSEFTHSSRRSLMRRWNDSWHLAHKVIT